MANQEHLEILRQGVEVWNQWRRTHLEVQPNLVQADLSGAAFREANLRMANLTRAALCDADLTRVDLRGATLSCAKLSGAKMNKADLDEAKLSRADLSRARLRNARLCKADLSGAILNGANLTKANLDGADCDGMILSGANLSWTKLRGANLTGVYFRETSFGNTALTRAKGLDTCHHGGPSTLDMRTLRRSWPLPLPFLRGCGLDDLFIEYLPSFMSRAIQFYSCFISYSSKDEPFAKKLHNDLQDNGVRCWFASEDLKIGDRMRPAIQDAIRFHDKLLLILSEHSVLSQWVEDEVERALEKERRDKSTVLFPIRLDDSVMDIDRGWAVSIRNTRHIGDFCSWDNEDNYSQAFERLLRDLRAS